jgi:hypothetical protein
VLIIAQVDNVARFYTTEPGKWQVSDHYADCTPWLMGKIVDNWSPDNYASTKPYPNYSNLHGSYNSTGRQRDDCREPVCSFTHRARFAPLSQVRLGDHYGVCRTTSKPTWDLACRKCGFYRYCILAVCEIGPSGRQNFFSNC